ncbi:sulfotransferase [Erythrobacteraceae bacterium CFH 75059]|uniref:sulfotransferase family protein n=1 Tax=Qipengyuania thermophila TaxID=2509361 RepID=UPI001021C6E4|nr:sulfotransferase [Qipengyuania thermophila]TCD06335.1 sulfotransferase [Erythrobacteraceae bacterium CFH 75059]
MAAPPRPHPLARARAAERLNELLGIAWQRGWSARPDLSAAAIFAAGAKGFHPDDERSGRNEADVADFRARLEVLAGALESEARLNNLGRTVAAGMLARTVRQRLALGRWWRHRPADAIGEIAPPLIVLGQMRGGTTRVHRLLAADPAHTATRFCDSWNPVPLRPDLRPLKGAAALRLARVLNPWLDVLHPMTATGVEEELGWLASALGGSAYYTQWHVPSFTRDCEDRDPAPLYREFGRILRTDAQHHGTRSRTRVLKVPEFTDAIPALCTAFPEARFVIARRDPAEAAHSAASLVAAQMAPQTDAADFAWILAEWERKTALRERHLDAAVTALGDRCVVVDFALLDRDWRAAMRGVYAALGRAWTPPVDTAMAHAQARMAQGAHREHRRQRANFAAAGQCAVNGGGTGRGSAE